MKKIFSFVLIGALSLVSFGKVLAVTADTTTPAIPTAATFSDVPQTNANYLAIKYLSEQHIVKGYADGTFKPEQKVNRAEAVKMILQAKSSEIPVAVTQVAFSDMTITDWFASYVMKAKEMGIVSGNPDGTFAPSRDVARAEFLKMLLNSDGFKPDKWANQALFPDVPQDAWFNAYMNYAGQAGVVVKDSNGNLNPTQSLTRGEVAETMYLMAVILKGADTQFLVSQAELQMAQIEILVGANLPLLAKRASELSVDFTQQALKNMPTDKVVLGAAKIARAYDFLMSSFIAAIQKNTQGATDWANQAIAKATEAWDVNNDLQPLAKHIKDSANQILDQVKTTA